MLRAKDDCVAGVRVQSLMDMNNCVFSYWGLRTIGNCGEVVVYLVMRCCGRRTIASRECVRSH